MARIKYAEKACPLCGRHAASTQAAALARRRLGCTERKSAVKVEQGRKNAAIARACRRKDFAEADRLRWLYRPELMRARALAESVGMKVPKRRKQTSEPPPATTDV